MTKKKQVKKSQRKTSNKRPARKAPKPQQLMRGDASYQRQRLPLTHTVRGTEQLSVVLVNPLASVGWKYSCLINPRRTQFNWLIATGLSYEMYHVDSMTFRYVPSCPSTQIGQVVMFIDYDPVDDNTALNFDALAAMARARVSQLYVPSSISFEPSMTVLPAHRYFCSDDGVADRLSDCGCLWAMTSGNVAEPTAVGKFYVDYTITFHNPEMPPRLVPSIAQLKGKKGVNGAALEVTKESILGSCGANNLCTTAVTATTNLAASLARYPQLVGTVNQLLSAIPKVLTEFPESQQEPNSCVLTSGHMSEIDFRDNSEVVGWAEVPDDRVFYIYNTDNDYLAVALSGAWSWTPHANDEAPVFVAAIAPGWKFTQGWMAVEPSGPYVADTRIQIRFMWRAYAQRSGSTLPYAWFNIHLQEGSESTLGASTAAPDNPNNLEVWGAPDLIHLW